MFASTDATVLKDIPTRATATSQPPANASQHIPIHGDAELLIKSLLESMQGKTAAVQSKRSSVSTAPQNQQLLSIAEMAAIQKLLGPQLHTDHNHVAVHPANAVVKAPPMIQVASPAKVQALMGRFIELQTHSNSSEGLTKGSFVAPQTRKSARAASQLELIKTLQTAVKCQARDADNQRSSDVNLEKSIVVVQARAKVQAGVHARAEARARTMKIAHKNKLKENTNAPKANTCSQKQVLKAIEYLPNMTPRQIKLLITAQQNKASENKIKC